MLNQLYQNFDREASLPCVELQPQERNSSPLTPSRPFANLRQYFDREASLPCNAELQPQEHNSSSLTPSRPFAKDPVVNSFEENRNIRNTYGPVPSVSPTKLLYEESLSDGLDEWPPEYSQDLNDHTLSNQPSQPAMISLSLPSALPPADDPSRYSPYPFPLSQTSYAGAITPSTTTSNLTDGSRSRSRSRKRKLSLADGFTECNLFSPLKVTGNPQHRNPESFLKALKTARLFDNDKENRGDANGIVDVNAFLDASEEAMVDDWVRTFQGTQSAISLLNDMHLAAMATAKADNDYKASANKNLHLMESRNAFEQFINSKLTSPTAKRHHKQWTTVFCVSALLAATLYDWTPGTTVVTTVRTPVFEKETQVRQTVIQILSEEPVIVILETDFRFAGMCCLHGYLRSAPHLIPVFKNKVLLTECANYLRFQGVSSKNGGKYSGTVEACHRLLEHHYGWPIWNKHEHPEQ